jgi:hypothetical protein
MTLLLACFAIVAMSAGNADAARRSALAGNQLIEDRDDLFAFPQLALKYNHSFVIDYAPYSGGPTKQGVPSGFNGSGTFIFGSEDWAVNLTTGRLHNGDGLPFWAWRGYDQQLYGGMGMIFTNLIPDTYDLLGPVEWFDLGFAWGGDRPMGFSLGMISNSAKYDDSDGDGNPQEDMTTTVFDIQYGVDLGDIDLAVEGSFGSAQDKLQDYPNLTNDTVDIGLTQFAASARGWIDDTLDNDWGWLLNFAYASAGDAIVVPDASGNPTKESSSILAFSGSYGPRMGDPGKWMAAAYLTVDYRKYSWVESDVYTYGDITEFRVPAWNLAGEYYVNKWLAVRGGVTSAYVMKTDKGKDATADPAELENKTREYEFWWTAGLGIDKKAWGLDMALNPSNLHSGYFPGGADNFDNVFALLSFWLHWGKMN